MGSCDGNGWGFGCHLFAVHICTPRVLAGGPDTSNLADLDGCNCPLADDHDSRLANNHNCSLADGHDSPIVGADGCSLTDTHDSSFAEALRQA